jgi:GNAT superfamily N-acetyltransferase
VLDEPQPRLRGGKGYRIQIPVSTAEYLEVRRLVASIFGGSASTYDPETDFYSAPDTMTYFAVHEGGRVISAASILIVNGIANVWSVGTEESARGRGAASVVVHACLVEAHRQGAYAAALGTSLELAREGGLYNRLGFEIIGHEHGWTLANFDRIELPT